MAGSEIRLLLGDCREKLKEIDSDSIDLVITSPPYANQRSHAYGGIRPDLYVEWFLPISDEILRVLKPSGTFILNIKENVVNGERHPYVLGLILFRDAWERLLQFNKSRKFKMYQEAVMVPMDDWAKSRLKRLNHTDTIRDPSRVGSGFGKKVSNWVNRAMAYPDNVLHLATECANKGHSAAFPEALPEWFIKLFTVEQDWVLDPFMGSGTTIRVAQRMGRNAIGIEICKQYYDMLCISFSNQPHLF